MEEDEELAVYDKVTGLSYFLFIFQSTNLSLSAITHLYSVATVLYTVGSLTLICCLQGFTDDQLMLVEHNTVMVEEREREIRQIVQSISDLNEIFRDLAGMVVEQVFDAHTQLSLHDFQKMKHLVIYLSFI